MDILYIVTVILSPMLSMLYVVIVLYSITTIGGLIGKTSRYVDSKLKGWIG